MTKERSKILDTYEKFNWFTMIGGLIIGGSVGLAIAAIDAAQIVAIRLYKKNKKKE